MKHLLLASVLSVAALSSQAAVLTFDDIPAARANTYGDLGTYQGFVFNSTLDWIDTVDSYWNLGAVSGEYTVLNNAGGMGVVTMVGGGDFTFDGVWAKTWYDSSARNVTVRGFNAGSLVFSSDTTINADFRFLSGAAGRIDRLELDLGDYFLIDNLALNESAVNDVPEPAPLALLALAAAGLLVARRRQPK